MSNETYGIPLDPHCDAIQIRALSTWYESDHDLFYNFLPATLGLVGESGELLELVTPSVIALASKSGKFADLIKKRGFKPGSNVSKADLVEELGDVLFYVGGTWV
jgi:NTP pyrophosphatase (non-canonical NTP hydrolase)